MRAASTTTTAVEPAPTPAKGGGGREALVLAALLLVLAVPRLVVLGADPPPDMTLHYLTDEGWWAHNARDHARFGRWIMDEHNDALIWAPLYTGALRVVYALLGVGLAPTRLLAALAGLATCFVVYGFVRASHGWRVAALATFLLGTDYLFLSYNRTGFVESFQTPFIAAACLATVAAERRRAWALAAGAFLALALLAKISALLAVGVVVAYWLVSLATAFRDHGRRRFDWMIPPLVAAGGLAIVAVAIVVAAPDPTILAPKTAQRVDMTVAHDPLLSLMTVGLVSDDEHVARVSGFVTQSPLLFAGGVLLALGALLVPRRRDALEVLCWCWVAAGIVMVGALRFWQPERRFLFMLPPLAILLARALAEPADDAAARPRPAGMRRLAAALLLAVVVGFVARPYPANLLHAWLGDPALGAGGGLGLSGAVALVWAALVVAMAPVAWMALGRLRAWPRFAVPFSAAVLVYGALNLGRIGTYLVAPTYAVRDASAQLAVLASTLPRDRRVAVGDVADTLGMPSDLFTFVIRRWPEKNMFMNLDGWERFAPAIAIAEDAERETLAARPDLVHHGDLLLAPDRSGVARRRVGVFVRRADLPR